MKFNISTKEPKTVLNHMGAPALRYKSELALVSLLLTSMVEDQYYRSTAEQASDLRRLVTECDKLFVAKAAIYARTKFGMRSISHATAAELARYISGEEWAKKFYDRIIHRPDDMTETLAFYFDNCGKKVPNALKKGFATAFNRFDTYQLAKYRGEGKAVKLIDLVNLVRPVPTERNADGLRQLVANELRNTDTWEAKLTSAGQNADDDAEKADLKGAAWAELLGANRLGYFALLRNLRNVLKQAPELTPSVCTQLVNRKAIEKSLVLPFRFLSAYEEIEKMSLGTGSGFEKDQDNIAMVLAALEDAVTLSVSNLPTLTGRTLILSDNSGSMTGDMGGSSLMSRFSNRKTSDIANLFAVLYWLKADNTLTGLFGDRLILPKLDRSKGVFDNFKIIDKAKNDCGRSTERGIFEMFERMVRERMHVDTAVIFSDCQIGTGCNWYDSKGNRGDNFMKLFAQYRAINPSFRCYSIDLKGYGTTVFDDSVIKIAGFSDKIFDIMKIAETDKMALINTIKAVEL